MPPKTKHWLRNIAYRRTVCGQDLATGIKLRNRICIPNPYGNVEYMLQHITCIRCRNIFISGMSERERRLSGVKSTT